MIDNDDDDGDGSTLYFDCSETQDLAEMITCDDLLL